MSRLHFSAFINDLKSINPRFNVRTSSLNGLITYLDRTVQHPSQFSLNEAQAVETALKFCRNPADPKLNKYRPAIARLTKVWGKGPQAYPLGSGLQKVDIKRLCFRGDSRPPETIFASGFTKRNEDEEATYREYTTHAVDPQNYVDHPMHGMSRAGDLRPSSAVCVSPSLNVATLFPLPDKPEENESPIFVYLVFLESGYNTNARQAVDFLHGISEIQSIVDSGKAPKRVYDKVAMTNYVLEVDYDIPEAQQARIRNIGQNLYGLEMAADAIDRRNVLAALEVKRSWKKVNPQNGRADYKEGGTFTVLRVIRNPRARTPAGFEGVIEGFLEKAKLKTDRMSVSSDGFHSSLKV